MNGGALVIDTMLLVLLLVGSARRDLVGRHKRLREYSPEDFDLLKSIVTKARQVLVTPNTLTETSNLIEQIAEPARSQIWEKFRQLVLTSDEEYVASSSAVAAPEFMRLGLADAALLEMGHGERLLLTADFDLYRAVLQRGAAVENFNHLREARGTVP